jgi:N-acetylglucosamine-6-phosphate deacetylase
MSQLGSRTPGLVGAALADPAVVCGLIADGHHVHGAAVRAAIRAKGAGGIALVSDAMPPAAGGPPVFALQGRRMRREGTRLIDDFDTLAGGAITLLEAVRYVVGPLGLPLADGLRMATSTPARLLGLESCIGALAPGARADLVHLGDDLAVRKVWLAGAPQAA